MNPDSAKGAPTSALESVTFTDGTPLSSYITNLRNTVPVTVSGWPLYGDRSDTYSTCAMLCPSLTDAQLAQGYTELMLADCSAVGLPYICRNRQELEEPEAEELQQAVFGEGGTNRKLLMTTSAQAAQRQAQARAQVDEMNAVTWPIVPESVPTVLGINATCAPMGAHSYCSFPASVKLSQSDWMYVCWEAGMLPLSIDSYAELTLMMSMTQPKDVGHVFTQTSSSAINSQLSNIYHPSHFMQALQDAAPADNGVDVSFTWTNTGEFYPVQLTAFDAAGSATDLPPYSFLSVNGTANPPGLTCGPAGYGFGCAAALAVSASGKPTGLTTISASHASSGMCKKAHDAPMPRPPKVPVLEVQFLYRFDMAATQVDRVYGTPELREEFATELAKVAVPAALPGMSPGDVIVPSSHAISRFNDPDINKPEIGQLGVLNVIRMPWPVGRPQMAQYLKNLETATLAVLPPTFAQKWGILRGTGVVSSIHEIKGN